MVLTARLSSLPRDARDTLFLLGVIALIVLPQVGNLPWWCSVATAGVLLWRGRLAMSGRPLPGMWWRGTLLALALFGTWFSHGTLLGRDAGVTMVVVLLALKTLEMRARRDAFVVFFLGFFAMLTNFFYSQSLPTAVAMLLALLGLLTALVNAHLPVGKPPLWQAMKMAGGMALLGLPIMLVLFMLFPRMAPLWGIPSDAMTGRSGLSGVMKVGTITELALDDSVAMRIKFEGNPPSARDLYFRGPVMTNFDGREWRPSRNDFAVRFGARADLKVSGPPIRYQVTIGPTSRPWLILLEATPGSPVLPGYIPFMQEDLQWMLNRPITDTVRYSAESYTSFTHGPQRRAAALQEAVELPENFDPRTRALGRDIRAANPGANTEQLVDVVMNRLRTGGYTYTLEPGIYGANTADEFLFDRKEGFCEHIASAFVILMRSMNVPARIVTGYQGGEVNNVDGFWTVRQSDAHAWAEVWQEGRGWFRVDPTSAVSPGRTGSFQRLVPQPGVVGQAVATFSPTLLAQMRATWEAVNNGWNQWVLNYTQSSQLELLKNIGFDSPSWEDLSYVLGGLIFTVALVGAGWTFWDRAQHDPWLRLLGRARRQLARVGIDSNEASSPRQLAQQLARRMEEQPATATAYRQVQAWLLQLEAQRYARNGPSPQALQQLRRQFDKLAWPAA